MKIRIAILVDGSFFIHRVLANKRHYFSSAGDLTPIQMVECLKRMVRQHLRNGFDSKYNRHYRTYFYDAPPLDLDRVHLPLVLEGEKYPRVKDFKKDPDYLFRKGLINELKKTKKLALRLGTVKADKEWRIQDQVVQALIKRERAFEDLTNDDFYYSLRQKGVDIKLGIDIATLSLRKLVDRIVLISGDSDFVPAAKLARVNGVEFILDAMRNQVDPSLFEHIDGLVNFDIVAILEKVLGRTPDVRPKWWGQEKQINRTKRRASRRKARRIKNN